MMWDIQKAEYLGGGTGLIGTPSNWEARLQNNPKAAEDMRTNAATAFGNASFGNGNGARSSADVIAIDD